jgi:capsular polysaccharide biosynthesis protein
MEGLDLRELLRIIRKWLWLMIVISILSAATSAYLSLFVLKKTYAAETRLLVNKQESDGISLADIALSAELIKTYNQIIKSDAVAEAVVGKLQLHMTVEKFNAMVKVSRLADSQVMSVHVTYSDPHMAVTIANTIAETFIAHVLNTMKLDNVSIVNQAKDEPNPQPETPNVLKNVLLAVVLGFFAAAGIGFLFEFMDGTIKNEDELKRLMGLPVLGTIGVLKDPRKRKLPEKESSPVTEVSATGV